MWCVTTAVTQPPQPLRLAASVVTADTAQFRMKICGFNTTPAVFACLQCFITILNVVLVVFALLLFSISILCLLWMEYYISANSKLAFAVTVFMISIALIIFCFSCLACSWILRTKTHRVFSYLVSCVLC